MACEQLVIAAGPWVRDLWAWLDLPERISVTERDGTPHADRPMWTYWALREGTLAVDPKEFTDNRGAMPPIMHVDSDAPLHHHVDGDPPTDRMWGIHDKPDLHSAHSHAGPTPHFPSRHPLP